MKFDPLEHVRALLVLRVNVPHVSGRYRVAVGECMPQNALRYLVGERVVQRLLGFEAKLVKLYAMPGRVDGFGL